MQRRTRPLTRTRLAALALSIPLGLAACGSDSADTDAGGDGGATTTTPDDGTAITPIGGNPGAIGTIEITITSPDADPLAYTIGCLGDAFPVTPEVPGISGEEACDRLADEAVLDRLVNGAPADRMCTEIYGGPEEAAIVGEINGMPIDTVIDRTNGCGIDDWDTLLAGVLPTAGL